MLCTLSCCLVEKFCSSFSFLKWQGTVLILLSYLQINGIVVYRDSSQRLMSEFLLWFELLIHCQSLTTILTCRQAVLTFA